MRRWWFLVLSAVSVAGWAAGDPVQDVAEKVLPTVVQLSVTPSGASGAGVIIDASGAILTSDHVIAGATAVQVTFSDGHRATASDVLHDPGTDLGLVKLEPRDAMQITAASFADPDSVHLAQLLIAFGGPFAPSASVSVAHVGALHRRLGIEKYEDFIQVDQTVAAASTGGPLFDNQGKLVGILSSAKPASGSFDGVGFAVSAMLCQAVGNGLLHYSKVPRSYLGIRTQALTSTDLQTYGVKNGIKVAEMPQADNPAVRAGVRIGDIVVSVDGKAVSDPYQSYLYITHLLPFHTVTLNVARDHANLVFYPELWELPDNDASAPPPPNTGQPPPVQQPGQNNPPPVTPPEPLSQYVAGLGVWVVPVTDAIAFRYGFARGTVPSQGLVITNVQAGSRADVPDLVQIGMVIVKAGDKAVATVDDLIGATPESDGGLLLQLVHPDGQVRYVELQ